MEALEERLTAGVLNPVDTGATTDFERIGFGVGLDIGGVDISFVGEE
jgi:hypothetical protein